MQSEDVTASTRNVFSEPLLNLFCASVAQPCGSLCIGIVAAPSRFNSIDLQ